MRVVKIPFSKILFIHTCIFSSITVNAQDTVPNNTGGYNLVTIVMIAIALLLAFVIWGMGQVLITLAKQALDKSKFNEKSLSVLLVTGLSCLSLTSGAQAPATASAITTIHNYGGMGSTAFWSMVSVIFTEMIVIGFVLFSIRRIQSELLPQKKNIKPVMLKEWWARIDKKLVTRAVAVEKEADILLDHDYDGIKELDNALPPWWKYGFILTIVVAFIYLLNFHVLGYGKNPSEEYQEELAEAQEQKELYESKNADKINESDIQMPQPTGLAAGKEIFTSICWTCHGKMGEGGAGPNLTDDYWIHRGSLTDIYLSIKHGYPDKGMQAWEKNYSPKEINNIAGYIKTLQHTNPPNAKAAQGDIYAEKAGIDTIMVRPVKPGKEI